MTITGNGKRYSQTKYESEKKDFEDDKKDKRYGS